MCNYDSVNTVSLVVMKYFGIVTDCTFYNPGPRSHGKSLVGCLKVDGI